MTESNFSYERYNSDFALKLRELLKTADDVKELANELHCSVQAVNQYKLGQAMPKVENLFKIAKHFNCSLDYLIGLSKIATPNADVKAICEYTGLSETAVAILHGMNAPDNLGGDPNIIYTLNCLIEDVDFSGALIDIADYLCRDFNDLEIKIVAKGPEDDDAIKTLALKALESQSLKEISNSLAQVKERRFR